MKIFSTLLVLVSLFAVVGSAVQAAMPGTKDSAAMPGTKDRPMP